MTYKTTHQEEAQDEGYLRRQAALMAFEIERQRIARASTPEEVLGLWPGVDERDARRTYFRVAKQVHPHIVRLFDPGLEGEATKVTVIVADAYAQIKDKNKGR